MLHNSSNKDEVIKTVFFFYEKILHAPKSTKSTKSLKTQQSKSKKPK